MNLDQRSGRPRQAVDLLQGMDHALGLHSAERPGQQRHVEDVGLAGGGEIPEGHLPELDPLVRYLREPGVRPGDRVRERVDRRDAGGPAGVPPGEAATSATDLEDLTSLDLDEIEQRVGFVALR